MRGGIVLFRGSGRAARHYLEKDHSLADDYYLEGGQNVAHRRISTPFGVRRDTLESGAYGQWVDWIDPITGEKRGKPRTRLAVEKIDGRVREKPASPMFAEMVINVPKSLSLAAELDPQVSVALDAAQEAAADALHDYLLAHTGPRGDQHVAFAERMESVTIKHRTSRAGDPHRHLHFQVSTRVFAEGKWRALDTDVMFRQQAVLRSLAESVMNTDDRLQQALAEAGFTFDPATGEITELEPFVALMSKRAQQVERERERLIAQWKTEHVGEPGPEAMQAIDKRAWAAGRPEKRPGVTPTHSMWIDELTGLGYHAPGSVSKRPHAGELDDEGRLILARDVLAALAAQRSVWSPADVHGMSATHLLSGRFGTVITAATREDETMRITDMVMKQCIRMTPSGWEGTARAIAARVWTSQHVLDADVAMRTSLMSLAEQHGVRASEKAARSIENTLAITLDNSQREAARAVAGKSDLVVIEGAAGAGKTTMLKVARELMEKEGRDMMVVTPTLKAAQAARREAGVRSDSLAKLLHANGFEWDELGRWTRSTRENIDEQYQLCRGQTIIVDEAGMVDVDTMNQLITLASENDARIVLVGDRAQLPAVGRGGVLDAAWDAAHERVSLLDLHRFRDEEYAELTLRLREREPDAVRELIEHGHVDLACDMDELMDTVATRVTSDIAGGHESVAVVATNEQARDVSSLIHSKMIERGLVGTEAVLTLADNNEAGIGDLIQIRLNNRACGVSNRDIYVLSGSDTNGNIILAKAGADRLLRTVPGTWLSENATLGWALTAHGVQGETVDRAHVLAGDEMDGAGLYVGLTRGREQNTVCLIAADAEHAQARLGSILDKDTADRGVIQAAEKNTAAMVDMYAPTTPKQPQTPETGDLIAARDKALATLTLNLRRGQTSATGLARDLELIEQLDQKITTSGHDEPNRAAFETRLDRARRQVRIAHARQSTPNATAARRIDGPTLG